MLKDILKNNLNGNAWCCKRRLKSNLEEINNR